MEETRELERRVCGGEEKARYGFGRSSKRGDDLESDDLERVRKMVVESLRGSERRRESESLRGLNLRGTSRERG